MSRIAYVNGRYLRLAEAAVSIEDRAFQFGDGVYEVCQVSGGALIDEARHLERLERVAAGAAHRRAGRRAGAAPRSCARSWRATGCATASSICRCRAASRGAITAFPPPRVAPGLVVTAKSIDPRPAKRNAGARRGGRHAGRRALGPSAHQDAAAAAQRAGQAGGARGGRLSRPGSSTRDGFVTEGASTNAWIVAERRRAASRGRPTRRSCAA